ncbi:phage major capsid protein [Halorubrum sp. AJ67]|uniref:phage major capsid protein n=1 Tax=Halorubrum sp. AJ67 TaxID=1173487 RepID=UPI0003DDA615|nr:phage major capsid protein [Halorubrum sp. AJ67]CDK39668.1 phage major capsid protein, HK97 family [Halorubrum sp. AJ67]
MSTILSNDVISQEAVRAEVESYAQSNRVFRQAFHPVDSTGIDSNTIEIPVLDETRAAGVVDEGTAYPSAGDATRKVTVEHDKYGVEVELTYESVEDALLDVVNLHTKERAQDLADALNEAAFAEISETDGGGNLVNLQGSVIGDGAGALAYEDVVDAMTALEAESYNPDLLIVSAQSKGNLMKSEAFTRASELGDDVVRDGAFGQVAGVDAIVDDSGLTSAGEAMMFDSARYGIESEREAMTSQKYEKESENKIVFQVRNRLGWKAIHPEAGVKIEA